MNQDKQLPQKFSFSAKNKLFLLLSFVIPLGFLFLIAVGTFAYFGRKNSQYSSQTSGDRSKTSGDRMDVYSNKHVEYLLNPGAKTDILDPQLATPNEEIFINALFDGLTEYDGTGTTIEPSLAVSWDKNEDFTVWTFHLRKDAEWKSDTPLTADDFVYSWRRALKPETKTYNLLPLFYLKNGEKFYQNQVGADEVGVKALDSYTLQVTLEKPIPFFDKLVATSVFRPVPKEIVEKFGTDWTKESNIAFSGAFFVEGTHSAQYLTLIRNERFWDFSNTKLYKINFYPTDNWDIRGKSPDELYQSKRIIATRNSAFINSLKDKKDLQVGVANGNNFLSLKTTAPPFDDVRVRKALSLAIDREKLKASGISQYPTTSFTPPLTGYENAKGASFNADEARRLLAEAGFANGKNFPEVEYIYYDSEKNTAVAEFVKSQLEKELRIKIKLNGLKFGDFMRRRVATDFKGLAAITWSEDYLDASNFLKIFSTDEFNTGWKNEKFNDLLNNANLEHDTAKRFAFLHEAEAILTEQQPAIPLYLATDEVLCKSYIKSLTPNPIGQVNWRKVYEDENLYK